MGKFVFVIGKITNNKLWYLIIIFIIIPFSISFILKGDVFLGIVLIIIQIPYLISRFKEIWLKSTLNMNIKGHNTNTSSNTNCNIMRRDDNY